MYKVARGVQLGPKEGHPRRVIFGLPHNYRFSDGSEATVEPTDLEEFGRRASPLFIHLHSFENGEVLLIQSVLTSLFLPQGAEIALSRIETSQKKRKVTTRISVRDINADYGVLKGYLDEFSGSKVIYG